MKELTKAEEQIMQYLWKIESGFLKDIIAQFPEPKPAHTTVSTVLRVLEKKEFVGYKTFGKIHEYYPKVPKETYSRYKLKGFMKKYFGNSPKKFVSFFTEDIDLHVDELEELKQIIDKQIRKKKTDD